MHQGIRRCRLPAVSLLAAPSWLPTITFHPRPATAAPPAPRPGPSCSHLITRLPWSFTGETLPSAAQSLVVGMTALREAVRRVVVVVGVAFRRGCGTGCGCGGPAVEQRAPLRVGRGECRALVTSAVLWHCRKRHSAQHAWVPLAGQTVAAAFYSQHGSAFAAHCAAVHCIRCLPTWSEGDKGRQPRPPGGAVVVVDGNDAAHVGLKNGVSLGILRVINTKVLLPWLPAQDVCVRKRCCHPAGTGPGPADCRAGACRWNVATAGL